MSKGSTCRHQQLRRQSDDSGSGHGGVGDASRMVERQVPEKDQRMLDLRHANVCKCL